MARATLSFFELPADDPGRLASFFRTVFGWEAVEVPWDGPRYLRLLPPDGGEPPGGGILERGSGERSLVDRLTVMIRIEGEPLDAVLARVEAAGGTVVLRPTRIGAFGVFARFLDPEGSSFGLWSSREEVEAATPIAARVSDA